MGGDGGSISQRVEMVRLKKKEKIEADPNQVKVDKWTTCSLSHEGLIKPIVVDELGNFYNKSAVIEYLLQKKTLALASNTQSQYNLFDHLTSLKDVWECKFYDDLDNSKKDAKSSQSLPTKKKVDSATATGEEIDFAGRRLSRFVCPITALPANGQYKFVAMRICGCILSEKALKEVPSGNCLGCGRNLKKKQKSKKKIFHSQPYYVEINPGQLEEDRLRKLIANSKKNKNKSENKEHVQDNAYSSAISSSSFSSSSSSSSLPSSSSSSLLSSSSLSSSSSFSSSLHSSLHSSSSRSSTVKVSKSSKTSNSSDVKIKLEEHVKNETTKKNPGKRKEPPKLIEPSSKKSKAQGYDVTQDIRWKTSAAFRSIFIQPGTPLEKPDQISTKMVSVMSQL